MVIFDKKGKLFGKISVVDILVVFVILAMIFGAFITYQKLSNKTVLTENNGLIQTPVADTLEVTLRVEEVRQMTVDNIKVDDEVFFDDTGKFFGTITDVTVEPATNLIFDKQGRPTNAVVPNRYDVVMKLRVPGSRLEHGYYTQDNIRLVFNSNTVIKTTTIKTAPIIENITVNQGE